jgi:hypothetical protein
MNNQASPSVHKRLLKNFKKMLRISRIYRNSIEEADKTLSSLARERSTSNELEGSSVSLTFPPFYFSHPKVLSPSYWNSQHSVKQTAVGSPQSALLAVLDVETFPNNESEAKESRPLENQSDYPWSSTLRRYPSNEYMENPKKILSRLVPIADQSTIWENHFHFSEHSLAKSSRNGRASTASGTSRSMESMKRMSKGRAPLSRNQSETDLVYGTKSNSDEEILPRLPKRNTRVKETSLIFSSTPGPQYVTYQNGLTESKRGKVNEFLIIREIGAGASCKVKLGQHEDTGCYYACKIVDKHRTNRTNRTFSRGPNASASNGAATHPSILREIEILKLVASHPHVNSLVEFIDDTADRNIYMGMRGGG